MTVSDLLHVFINAAAPFAAMLSEIWQYLADITATRANESIRIRVGLDQAPVELECFREWATRANVVLREREIETWPMHGLFYVARAARGSENLRNKRDWGHYRSGERCKLLPLPPERAGVYASEYERMLRRVYDVLQSSIDDEAYALERRRRIRELSELIDQPRPGAGILMDLLPLWTPLFDAALDTPFAQQQAALRVFRDRVEPEISSRHGLRVEEVRELLDVLDLPFWKHRWRTYEIWITVVALQSVAKLSPVPNVIRGELQLGTSRAARVATLSCRDHPSACVVAQMHTAFESGKRRTIRPDLSFCFDDRRRGTSRAVVIEAKQRTALTVAHVASVGSAYRDGSPKASGVIIVNYDDAIPDERSLPDRVEAFGGVRPGGAGVEDLRNAITRLVDRAGLVPRLNIAVFLDVSGSMAGHYTSAMAREGLRQLCTAAHIKIERFRDHLLPGGDATIRSGGPMQTSGQTDLAASFKEYLEQIGHLDVLLVVSDGKYPDAPALLKVPLRMVCESCQPISREAWRGAEIQPRSVHERTLQLAVAERGCGLQAPSRWIR